MPVLPTPLADDHTTPLLIPHLVPNSTPATSIVDCTNFAESSLIPPTDSTPELPISFHSFSLPLRKSTRIHKAPSYLQDYACNLLVSKPSPGAPYDINQCISYANMSAFHKAFVFVASAEIEP